MEGRRSLKKSKTNSSSNRKEKRKSLNQKRVLFGIIIILFLIFFILIHKNKNITEGEAQIEQSEDEFENQKIVNQLSDKTERYRIEYYLAEFINRIEAKQYEAAYELLYDEFRNRYFPTLEEFEEYAKKTFPDMMNIEHENIERNGNAYVLWVKISDVLNGTTEEGQDMNFVIREDDLNKYVLSFSVK